MSKKVRDLKYSSVKQAILDYIRDHKLVLGDQIFSISEIMERYNVSKVTAVRAIVEMENEGHVRREHGRGTFVASLEGKSLESRRRTVGVAVPNTTNPFYGEIVGTFERILRDSGFVIELSTTDYSPAREKELLQGFLASQHIIAIAMIDLQDPHSLEAALNQLPVILIDECPRALLGRVSAIISDNFRGGREAARHLVNLGHRRIGYLDLSFSNKDRLGGFRAGLQEANSTLPDSSIVYADSNKPLEEELLRVIRSEQLTGLACINDMLAMQAMQILRRNGYQIPRDISIIGYDDIEPVRYIDIPLTTIEQHEIELGQRAAEILIERLEENVEAPFRPCEIVFIPKLIVRGSTAPPAASPAD